MSYLNDEEVSFRTKENKNLEWIGTLVGIIIAYLMMGLVVGFISSVTYRAGAQDGCRYKSYLSYINPAYIGACELTRVRFVRPETDYYDVIPTE